MTSVDWRGKQKSVHAPGMSSDAERFAIYQKLEAMLADEVPIIPLYFYTRVFAMNPKLRFVPNVIDNRSWKFVEFLP